uniref:Protein krueppel n=1 Tax=Anopheles minimus TaxID=112268 RepID=A0A182W521_9DIPT
MDSRECTFSIVCRFCLCQEREKLMPFSMLIDNVLTAQDIQLLTGIENLEDNTAPYVVCDDCDETLNKFVSFRDTCSKNDIIFWQICTELSVDGTIEVTQEDAVHDKAEEQPYSILFDANECVVEQNETTAEVRPQTKRRRKKLTNGIAGEESGKKLCDMCGAFVSELGAHRRVHTKETPYTCTYCGISMTHNSNLLRHIDSVHLKRIIKRCEVCNKGFTSYFSYGSHMRSHHSTEKKYECKTCNKKFNHHSSLWLHNIRAHNDERKFKCTACGLSWKTKESLKTHERSHSSERPFSCQHCSKQFKTRYGWKSHELTHTGIIFSCQYCDKTYRYKTLINAHIRNAHPDEVLEATN